VYGALSYFGVGARLLLLRCQYLYFCTSKASTFELVNCVLNLSVKK
jgi:hypothetical protein